jgi:hypothetical protein
MRKSGRMEQAQDVVCIQWKKRPGKIFGRKSEKGNNFSTPRDHNEYNELTLAKYGC